MVLGWSQDGGGEESGLCGWLSRVRGSVRRWQKGSQPPGKARRMRGQSQGECISSRCLCSLASSGTFCVGEQPFVPVSYGPQAPQ